MTNETKLIIFLVMVLCYVIVVSHKNKCEKSTKKKYNLIGHLIELLLLLYCIIIFRDIPIYGTIPSYDEEISDDDEDDGKEPDHQYYLQQICKRNREDYQEAIRQANNLELNLGAYMQILHILKTIEKVDLFAKKIKQHSQTLTNEDKEMIDNFFQKRLIKRSFIKKIKELIATNIYQNSSYKVTNKEVLAFLILSKKII